jgi:hypothetical protein
VAYFKWYFHPSSGAHTPVSTASGMSHRYCYLPLSWKSWNRFECAVGGVRCAYEDKYFTSQHACLLDITERGTFDRRNT